MYGWLEGLGIIIRPQEQPSPVALRSWEINISAVGQDDSQDQSALFPRAFLGAWAAVTQRDDLIITHLNFPISVALPLWGCWGHFPDKLSLEAFFQVLRCGSPD